MVNAPWGPRQPEPYFDKPMKLYHVSLQRGTRSPFRAPDELAGEDDSVDEEASDEPSAADDAPIEIDLDGIERRVKEVPIPPGDYRNLVANDSTLFWIARDPGRNPDSHFMAVAISPRPEEPTRIVADSGRSSFPVTDRRRWS